MLWLFMYEVCQTVCLVCLCFVCLSNVLLCGVYVCVFTQFVLSVC